VIKLLSNLVGIQFKTFFRQPDVIFWAIVFPLILLFVLGIAFDNKKAMVSTVGIIKNTNFEIPEKPLTLISKEIGKKIIINIKNYPDQKTAIKDVKRGHISLFIVRHNNKLNYYFDPQNTNAQKDYLLIQNILTYKTQKNDQVIELKAKGTRYIDFFLPGLLAFNIMSSCFWGIGWSYIELRMKKYLKRLTATPMSKLLFLFSYIITRLIISGFEICIFILFAYYTFGISISGSYLALFYLWLIGNLSFAGIGVLIGSRTASSITGNGILNAIMMPMMLASGIFFSYYNYPKIIIPFIKILPLTILADSLRAVFNEGAGLTTIVPASFGLVLFGLISYIIGIKIFKWY
jgi:ABC-type multidrug transport system permease subunit